MSKLINGEIEPKLWREAIAECLEDASMCKAVCAYNAAFDFRKAISFTERYINALYGSNYSEWERKQKNACTKIANGYNTARNDEYLSSEWLFHNQSFDIIDLWSVACEKLINTDRYKKFCIDNEYWTASTIYFKTSAEIVYRYLMQDNEFIEAHTALDDALIESEILARALKKGKVEACVGSFPFRTLGTTVDFVCDKKHPAENLKNKMADYLKSVTYGNYAKRIENLLGRLEEVC